MFAMKRNVLASLCLGFLFVFASGCKEEEAKKPPCEIDIRETVPLSLGQDPNQLKMTVEQLQFLSDSDVEWEDIELEVNMSGKRTVGQKLALSFNGFKFNRKDGRQTLENLNVLSQNNQSIAKFKLHRMYLNGADPFHLFLARIKKNKGVLDVKISGKDVKIINAKMTFKGRSKKNCPKPTPTPGSTPTPAPTPTPVAPETNLDSVDPSQSPTASTTIAFYFSSSTEGNTFWCSLDSSTPELCTSPKSYSNLASGAHTFRVMAQSPQGLTDSTPASYSWTVDTVAPSAVITNAGQLPTLTKSRDISFSFDSNEDGSAFLCSLDGGTAVACTSPRIYTGLSEGAHTFSVSAIDNLGNGGAEPATFRWTVDVTAPVTSFIDIFPPDAESNISSKTFTFSASETASFECSLNGSTFTACASPTSLANLAEGSYRFEVRATDPAGNQGLPSSYTWEIDTTAPVISLGAVSPAVGLTNAKNISVEFTVNETATAYCRLDGGAPAICQSPVEIKDLPEGGHLLEISAADVSGNLSSTMSLQWEMDHTAPVLSFGEILPSAESHLSATNVEIPVNLPAGTVLYASVNNSTPALAANPIQLNNLVEGVYSVSVYAVDTAGNASTPLVHQFIIDRTAPSVGLISEVQRDPTNSDRNSFDLSSTEENVIFECNLDFAGFAPCQSPKEVSGLADGNHTMELRATDLAGNVSGTVFHSWEVDTKPPTTTAVGTSSGDQATINLFTSEPDSPLFFCSLDGAPLAPCNYTVTYTGLSLGSHTFLAKAVDDAGNMDPIGAVYQFAVIKPIHTTITSVDPSTSPTNQLTMTFNFVADQSNASFVCSLDGGAEQICSSPKTYTGLGGGTHTFLVKAVDAFGNKDAVGASYTWTIDNTAPKVTGPSYMVTSTTITVSWTTDEPATEQVIYGLGSNLNMSTTESTTYTTSHSVLLTGLTPNTTYSIQVKGRDAVGNIYLTSLQFAKTSR